MLEHYISEVGFPIAISVFVLVRLNGKLDRMVKSIEELRLTLVAHISVSEELGKVMRRVIRKKEGKK